MLKLIVGLGNPGPEYEGSRHNAGFDWVDRLCGQSGIALHEDKRHFGRVGRGMVAGCDLRVLEPGLYMNRSGQSVGALARFLKIVPAEILVVHDDLDLPPGALRLKQGGGHGGHNGLRDIVAHLGSADFWRLRLGIGHPGDKAQVADWVLKPPRRGEQEAIERAMDRALEEVSTLVHGDFPAAMMRLHGKAKEKA